MVLQFDLLTFVCVCVCVYGMQRKRLTLLMAAALFQGASIGPLIDLAIQIDPRYASLHLCFSAHWDLSFLLVHRLIGEGIFIVYYGIFNSYMDYERKIILFRLSKLKRDIWDHTLTLSSSSDIWLSKLFI
jgi:hypothetical protein